MIGAGLDLVRQLAPSGALAVDQLGEADRGGPAFQAGGVRALFLEIMEVVVEAVVAQPLARFLTVLQLGMP
ncbi:hypothetical protein [Chromobacterium haemolyticum]|uniref:hypothetical protein n=1 Tax=Chromobacterium haemolyticum TaxID=394935 RepID=UPI002952E7F4|nr:hypothetical protein [Chromobacterium haemolyticum]WON85167.1 hypothetical protein OK026_06595 [Chromobacterium haemolyticum]